MASIINLPNFLSLLRLPLALLFIKQNIALRTFIILSAMATDGLDGFLARRYNKSSQFGALLDPLMDRFFIFTLIGLFYAEGRLGPFELMALLCRDMSVMLFGLYLLVTSQISTYRFRAIWCGKATTFFQFLVFLGLTLDVTIYPTAYLVFIFIGILALVELYISKESIKATDL